MILDKAGAHPKALLNERGLQPKKSFGQNFLLSKEHLSAIAARIDAFSKESVVVEFGAGLGALTAELLRYSRKVVAVERDRELVPVLNEIFAAEIDAGRLLLLEADAKTVDLKPYMARDINPVVCGNLPYHITGQLLRKAIDSFDEISGAVFLMQLEVGERLMASPGNKNYGVLSVLAQSRFNVSKVADVSRECFWPSPRVDSAVMCFVPKIGSNIPRDAWPVFCSLVKAAFSQRRKTLRNCLKSYENIEELLGRLGLHGGLRAETLTVEQYMQLSQSIMEFGPANLPG